MSGGQGSLSVADPLYNVPWQNFVQNSAIILSITFSVPVGIILVLHSFRPHSKFDPELFSLWPTAPLTIIATLLLGLFLNYASPRVRKFFESFSDLCGGARTVTPKTEESAKSEESKLLDETQVQLAGEGSSITSQSGWPAWLMQLVVFAFLPVITWSSPILWLDGVAEAYVGCSFACNHALAFKKLKYPEFCGDITKFSDMFGASSKEELKNHWPKERLESSFNTKKPKVVLEKCQSIMHGNKTKWADEMQNKHMYFLVFEAQLRRHYEISSVEVFGSLLGGVIIVL